MSKEVSSILSNRTKAVVEVMEELGHKTALEIAGLLQKEGIVGVPETPEKDPITLLLRKRGIANADVFFYAVDIWDDDYEEGSIVTTPDSVREFILLFDMERFPQLIGARPDET